MAALSPEDRLGQQLVDACNKKNSAGALELIKKDNINLNFESIFNNGSSDTPLIAASSHGLLDVVDALLAKGADVNITDSDGNSALMRACLNSKQDVALKLLNQPNIDIHLINTQDDSAESLCSDNNLVDVKNKIIELKKKPLTGGKRSRTQRKRKDKCRLVVGKRETCCIKPKKGHWCWSKGTKRRISRKMKRNCCR